MLPISLQAALVYGLQRRTLEFCYNLTLNPQSIHHSKGGGSLIPKIDLTIIPLSSEGFR